jgi:hypothetical protein
VGAKVLDYGEVLHEPALVRLEDAPLGDDELPVEGDLGKDLLACFMGLLVMMEVLDGLLKADGNEQANNDRGDVDEETLPSVDGFMWCVDFKHGR